MSKAALHAGDGGGRLGGKGCPRRDGGWASRGGRRSTARCGVGVSGAEGGGGGGWGGEGVGGGEQGGAPRGRWGRASRREGVSTARWGMGVSGWTEVHGEMRGGRLRRGGGLPEDGAWGVRRVGRPPE